MAIRLEDTLVGYPERIRSLAEVESVIKKSVYMKLALVVSLAWY